MNKFLIFIITLFISVSCANLNPENNVIPDPAHIELVSVPYTIHTATVTKVAYNNIDGYTIKDGDRLHIFGTDREDINGYLDYDSNNNEWSGDLWYNPDTETGGGPLVSVGLSRTPLTVVLVHADNTDESTYANSISDTFQNAVEMFSLLEGNTSFGSSSVMLHQKACFINASVSFRFVGIGNMPTGSTIAELIVGEDTLASGNVNLKYIGEVSGYKTYNSSFVIIVPGDTELTAGNSFIKICDRNVLIRETTGVSLVANKSYNLSRTYDFKPEIGDPYWSDGTYGRIEHPSGVDVVGIIVYVNNYEDNDDSDIAKISRALTEKDYGYGHALVMSLKNAASNVKWGTATQYTTFVTTPAATLDESNISGYHNSDLQSGNTAVDYALGYRNTDVHTGDDSGWFLPTVGQWIYSISRYGFGGADPVDDWRATNGNNWLTQGGIGNLVLVKKGETDENLLVISLNERLETLKKQFGCDYDSFGMSQGTLYGDNYWTSTEYSSSEAIRMNLGSVEKYNNEYYSTIKVAKLSKSKTNPGGNYAFCVMKVRPFLAF